MSAGDMPKRAHLYVRDGRLTLAIVTGLADGTALNFPDDIGPVLVFSDDFEVTVSEERA